MSMTIGVPNPRDQAVYTLLSGANAPSAGTPSPGLTRREYSWKVEGNLAGMTATLQELGLDGTTWGTVVCNEPGYAGAAATAESPRYVSVQVRPGASVRVLLSGVPTGTPSVFSTIAG